MAIGATILLSREHWWSVAGIVIGAALVAIAGFGVYVLTRPRKTKHPPTVTGSPTETVETTYRD